jgi:hypothetical protein
MSVLQKALDSRTLWTRETFEELPSVVYWVKQISAIALGVAAWAAGDDVVGFNMMIVVAAFLAVNSAIAWVYYSKYLSIDEEDFDSKDMVMEGMGPSVSFFLATWTVLHTFTASV